MAAAAHSRCCPTETSALIDSARCLLAAASITRVPCTNNATAASAVGYLGFQCLVAPGARRGFFFVSRAQNRVEVCTGGDTYRVHVNEVNSQRSRYSAYAAPVDDSWPSLYWVDTGSGTALPGRAAYTISAVLLETPSRDRQVAEGREPLHWSVSGGSPVREWFRYRQCLSTLLHLPQPAAATTVHGSLLDRHTSDGGKSIELMVVNAAESPRDEPRCRALPPGTHTAMRALEEQEDEEEQVVVEGARDPPPTTGTSGGGAVNASSASNRRRRFACGALCTGDAHTRVLRPFRGPKDVDRAALGFGFRHILKPDGCRYHMYDEAELTRCLARRSVLNIGGSVANGVQRGFERLSSREEGKRSWWWEFGRTGISNMHDESPGKSRFNGSVITTQFIHHPFRHGLTNVVAPDPKKVVGYKTADEWEHFMCKHDIVVFESGVHDFASPDRRAHRQLLGACAHAHTPCTDEQLLPMLLNQTWRLDMLASYRTHLEQLMGMWDRCRARRQKEIAAAAAHSGSSNRRSTAAASSRSSLLHPFRPIFKLSMCVNPATEAKSCASEWGYNTEGFYLLVANQVAREVVEKHGFEVFDAFPATQHASPLWFDERGHDAIHSDPTSDMVTQMLINQLCE